jgi:hypothetical protein
MERKKTSLASLLMVLLAFLALVPPATSAVVENHRYIVMGGFAKGCSDLVLQPATVDWKTPFQTRPPDFMPFYSEQNITFSDPWTLPGYGLIVNLTVPYETYAGLTHAWYDAMSSTWYRLVVTLEQDGYGWVFLNDTSDVDSLTFNDENGVFWHTPVGVNAPGGASPQTGALAAATGILPNVGPDGVGGTADDGFGDGTLDPPGSSILLVPSRMHVDFWTGSAWNLLFEGPWPQVFTTEWAYDIVLESDQAPGTDTNELYGWNSSERGQPWEFFAGLDHSEYKVEYGHPKWNAYVTYVCAWSVIDQETALGELDVIFQVGEKKVREDCAIADVNCDEQVDIVDIVICALAFGAKDEGPGTDGTPGTIDDKPVADPNYDARGDVSDARGEIDIVDIVRIAINFGWKLTPDCIQK